MRVLHSKKRWNYTKLVLLTLGITSLGIAIAGVVVGNPFLIGGGVAGVFLMGALLLNSKMPSRPDIV